MNISDHPFPHAIVDGMWDDELLRSVLAEFPEPEADGWIRYGDPQHEVKLEGPDHLWGPNTFKFVEAIAARGPEFAQAFGMPELTLRTEGGGYHYIEPGGKLAVHADFNRSDEGLYRRLNVICYLNPDWTEEDGGKLELFGDSGPVAEVLPQFNRTLVFETSDKSFHGHPTPLPGPRPRRSFAAYFFSVEAPEHYVEDHTTVWYE
ncbi:2OG-Fe(II) oxygenase [Micromonospora sp. NIE79]|uniref:2OG-Fe(II) oxygenase n=1 Tax=Micromonospora trifolii TaxID=2911208 RepID=A0ABS9NBH2_9ACTN|nr:2OG-Fe(II) oxygenase [Micromonospora trifolii]MCG5447300.1 2OG-Fe(II) oxygenase [Micromonospora trifolii]